MFDFFKKKQADSPNKASWGGGVPIMSAVLLEQESFASDSFLKQMAKSRVRGKAVSDIKPEKGGVFSFDVGDESLVFLHVEAPYPDDPEGPIATSWLWPREPHRKRQTAPHISAGHDDRRCRRPSPAAADIDPVTALAAKQSGVMAVYWADASLVIFPPLFIDMAEETNTLQ